MAPHTSTKPRTYPRYLAQLSSGSGGLSSCSRGQSSCPEEVSSILPQLKVSIPPTINKTKFTALRPTIISHPSIQRNVTKIVFSPSPSPPRSTCSWISSSVSSSSRESLPSKPSVCTKFQRWLNDCWHSLLGCCTSVPDDILSEVGESESHMSIVSMDRLDVEDEKMYQKYCKQEEAKRLVEEEKLRKESEAKALALEEEMKRERMELKKKRRKEQKALRHLFAANFVF